MHFERERRRKKKRKQHHDSLYLWNPFIPDKDTQCSLANQWSTLLVCEKHHTAREPSVQPADTLDHAERAQDGEGERTPVHKGVSLVSEDTKEGPHDGNRCRQVTLSGSESVSCGSALEEEAV